MELEIRPGEIEQICDLANLLSEMIRQFIRTREELMRTTFQVQIELLTGRLKRLKVSIMEIKSQIDEACIPEEVMVVESELGNRIRPYEGAEIETDNTIKEFSWKNKGKLEQEKEDLLSQVSGIFHGTIERIYGIYVTRANQLCVIEEKSRLK